jgi:hypothetical protein
VWSGGHGWSQVVTGVVQWSQVVTGVVWRSRVVTSGHCAPLDHHLRVGQARPGLAKKVTVACGPALTVTWCSSLSPILPEIQGGCRTEWLQARRGVKWRPEAKLFSCFWLTGPSKEPGVF